MTGRIITAGLVFFLIVGGALMLLGPGWGPSPVPANLPPCPHLRSGDLATLSPGIVAAAGAYEAIRETLTRGSIDGIAEQAGVIERAFAADEPKIASLVKRLAAEQDVESAKRAFMRLNRLMEKNAARLSRN